MTRNGLISPLLFVNLYNANDWRKLLVVFSGEQCLTHEISPFFDVLSCLGERTFGSSDFTPLLYIFCATSVHLWHVDKRSGEEIQKWAFQHLVDLPISNVDMYLRIFATLISLPEDSNYGYFNYSHQTLAAPFMGKATTIISTPILCILPQMEVNIQHACSVNCRMNPNNFYFRSLSFESLRQ